jgi:hypothetical protein
MYSSATVPTQSQPPTLGVRITVLQRRFRFALLLSQLTGRSLREAWRAFRPLQAPDGARSREPVAEATARLRSLKRPRVSPS